jgi:hypothetical protein
LHPSAVVVPGVVGAPPPAWTPDTFAFENEIFILVRSGLMTYRIRKAQRAATMPRIESSMIPLALLAVAVLPALDIYIKPPITSIRRPAIPTVQIPNLYILRIYVGRSFTTVTLSAV